MRSGGTLLTPVGELEIRAVSRVAVDRTSEAEATLAGYESLGASDALSDELELLAHRSLLLQSDLRRPRTPLRDLEEVLDAFGSNLVRVRAVCAPRQHPISVHGIVEFRVV